MSQLTRRRFMTLLAMVAFLAVPVRASDPVGIYAAIDRVVLDPNDSAPAAVQIWGVFALSNGKSGDDYLPPQRGYLYYKVNPSLVRAKR